jgi:hypothetical protein
MTLRAQNSRTASEAGNARATPLFASLDMEMEQDPGRPRLQAGGAVFGYFFRRLAPSSCGGVLGSHRHVEKLC